MQTKKARVFELQLIQKSFYTFRKRIANIKKKLLLK